MLDKFASIFGTRTTHQTTIQMASLSPIYKEMAIFSSALIAQIYMCVKLFHQDFPTTARWLCLLCGLATLVTVKWLNKILVAKRVLGHSPSNAIRILLCLQFITIVILLLVFKLPFQLYADTEWMIRFVEQGTPFSRWLQSTSILGFIYSAIWKNPIFLDLAPAHIQMTATFLRLAGMSTMFATAIYLLKKDKNVLPVSLCVLSFVWAILSTGFLKSYPFVAPVLLFGMWWITSEPIESRKPRDLGILLSVLATSYIGLVPFSAMIIAVLAFKHPRKLVPTIVWMIAISFLIISLLWPGTPATYFNSLYSDMNLGEIHTAYLPYRGWSAGSNSINFSWKFIFSEKHLMDKLYILNYSGTLSLIALISTWIMLKRKDFIVSCRKILSQQDSR
ncbi:MAG: hypothetical protein NTX25_23635, partial [Proteobacteria bacterium]|nr:hypothetical protein [Pseudomonadota bacterium]